MKKEIMEVSMELPYFNADLYVSLERLLYHIEDLAKTKRPIHLVLGGYYEVEYQRLDYAKVRYDMWGAACVRMDFMKGEECVGYISIPKGKIYKICPNDEYIEILDGFDYSEDPEKLCGEEVRAHE